MLMQSPSKIHRSKGFKVKHVVQMFVLLAIGFWLINQLRYSYHNKKGFEDGNRRMSENVDSDNEILKLGRKGLHPRIEGTLLDESRDNKGDLEEEIEEVKPEEVEDDGRGGGDDEIDGHDQEELAEEVEDLIDVDDREREEGGGELDSEEKSTKLEAGSSMDDRSETGSKRNFLEAKEEHLGDDNASGSTVQNTQTMSTEFGIGGLRSLKEEETWS